MAIKKRKVAGSTTLPCGCTIQVQRIFRGNAAESLRVQKSLAHQIGRKAAAHVCPPKPEAPTDEPQTPAG
ncbi:MAG: hypothetical protein AB7V08_13975 [Elusimicrobiales bacterium]